MNRRWFAASLKKTWTMIISLLINDINTFQYYNGNKCWKRAMGPLHLLYENIRLVALPGNVHNYVSFDVFDVYIILVFNNSVLTSP